MLFHIFVCPKFFSQILVFPARTHYEIIRLECLQNPNQRKKHFGKLLSTKSCRKMAQRHIIYRRERRRKREGEGVGLCINRVWRNQVRIQNQLNVRLYQQITVASDGNNYECDIQMHKQNEPQRHFMFETIHTHRSLYLSTIFSFTLDVFIFIVLKKLILFKHICTYTSQKYCAKNRRFLLMKQQLIAHQVSVFFSFIFVFYCWFLVFYFQYELFSMCNLYTQKTVYCIMIARSFLGLMEGKQLGWVAGKTYAFVLYIVGEWDDEKVSIHVPMTKLYSVGCVLWLPRCLVSLLCILSSMFTAFCYSFNVAHHRIVPFTFYSFLWKQSKLDEKRHIYKKLCATFCLAKIVSEMDGDR